jgi:hypothetical protein
MLGFGEFLDFIGLSEIHELDQRFASAAEPLVQRGENT